MTLLVKTERKIDSEPCLATWSEKLIVGTDNGFINTYDEHLNPSSSWMAHGVQLFALAASEGKVYSASNDGGVRVWTSAGDKISELPPPDGDIGSLCVFGKLLYAGDELGNVYVFEDTNLKAKYNVLEEVKDLEISPPFMFTARDLYVTVTEIKPDVSKDRFVTQHVMEGRAPLRISGSKLVVTGRGGNNIQLHELSLEKKFNKLHEVKVSDMILTSLAVVGNMVWTGGWDGCMRRWKIDQDKLHPDGEINLGTCINSLVATTEANAYALLSDKRIVNVVAK
ncbi:uncharacterized protein LOC116767596 [Danaus plexippus]|uniref:Polyadenylation factor subunit n=1 Tax=Danaus plexippus plexippus TaxID=278856 RepID=A0A212F6X8_DANPL|nr:uncharacterized protein LOC116767596 [Danaus plexippus]OWR49495.1 putative Polyadenylation factor subunit [Danaus plexippus plexippus]